MRLSISFVTRTVGLCFVGAVLYLMSYAPFLWLDDDLDDVYYRSPVFYRPAEWVILRTPLQACMLRWSDLNDVRSETELQVWFYAQGLYDPVNQIDFNIRNWRAAGGTADLLSSGCRVPASHC